MSDRPPREPAVDPAAEPPPHRGTLYVVATPLGNLEDVTLRALRVLRECALIACEDTRRTAGLLQRHGITTQTTSYFEHNETWKGDQILAVLRAGHDVALVSDAGTPGVSDPGYRLVRDARGAGLAVVPVPGPSAAVAALSVSGLPTDRFLFLGFLPHKQAARRQALAESKDRVETLVVYESPQRVLACLDDMVEVWGDRSAFLCREATKLHEEYVPAKLSELRQMLGGREVVRGEIALVIGGAATAAGEDVSEEDVAAMFASLIASGLSRREAVKQIARRTGLPAREVYARTL